MNIERGIPAPTDRHRKKWEFDTMTEGDSTFLRHGDLVRQCYPDISMSVPSFLG